jgi:hypothetical protein
MTIVYWCYLCRILRQSCISCLLSSLDIGAVPQDWRDAWVVPIFKKDERHIAANNRPVSTCDPFAKRLTISCTVMTSCDSQDRLYLKPCYAFDKMLAGRSKVNITSSPVRNTTGLSVRPPPVLSLH